MKLEILILALALGIARAMPVEKEPGSVMAIRQFAKSGEPCVVMDAKDDTERCGLNLVCLDGKCTSGQHIPIIGYHNG